jgi:hypothetical protein
VPPNRARNKTHRQLEMNNHRLTRLRTLEAPSSRPIRRERPRRVHSPRRGRFVERPSRLCSRAAVMRRLSTDSSQQIRLRARDRSPAPCHLSRSCVGVTPGAVDPKTMLGSLPRVDLLRAPVVPPSLSSLDGGAILVVFTASASWHGVASRWRLRFRCDRRRRAPKSEAGRSDGVRPR